MFRLALMLVLLGFTGCRTPLKLPLQRFEFTEPQMGVPFRIVLYAADRAQAEAASRAAFDHVAALNQKLSDYETDSELNELSRTSGRGRAVPVSPELWFMLSRSQDLARRTEGAFDITVGPCVSLWRKARRDFRQPDPARLELARKAVGYSNLVLDPSGRTARLLVPNMKLDLGGIAKGYAADEILKVLRRHGVTRALVAASSDAALGDPPPGKAGWTVEMAPLDDSAAAPAQFLRLANAAIATSGDLFQRLEIDGRRYSHIVDPRTGIGLTDHSLVTIIARDCTTADSLATAVSVLGPIAGLRLVESLPGVAARVVRKPGAEIETMESKGFAQWCRQKAP